MGVTDSATVWAIAAAVALSLPPATTAKPEPPDWLPLLMRDLLVTMTLWCAH